MNKTKGFSLIELAMILIIIGILMSVGLTAFSVLIKKAKYEESKAIINAAVDGIIGFASTYKHIPSNSDELLQAVKRNKDAYTKELLYIYDETASNSCGINSTNITIHICKDATCSSFQEIQNVAFLVVSGGANYNIQTGNSSLSIVEQPPSKPFWVVKVSSATTINVYDYGTNNIDNFPSDMNRPEDYDDIVKWVNVYELQTKASSGCQSLHIITENPLPQATEGQSYNYQLQAEGGKAPYTWSGTIGHGLTLDSNGLISGNLNKCVDGNITFTIEVTDDTGYSVSKDFTIPVKHIPVEITTTSLPSTLQGSSYTTQVYATGGDGTYTFSGTKGNCSTNANLLSELSILSDGRITGNIGTDSNDTCDADTCPITITASSCGGSRTDTKILPLTVNDPDCSTAGGGSGGGSGGGGSGGGGGGGSSCTSYNIVLIKSGYSSNNDGDVDGVFFNSLCHRTSSSSRGRFPFNNVSPGNIILYNNSNCTDQIASYDLASIDTDGDCNVYISCAEGQCRTYNTETVFCPTAKFYRRSRINRVGFSSGGCGTSILVTSSGTVYGYSDKKCKSTPLCGVHFGQSFNPSIDTDYDCKVNVGDNGSSTCSLSDH